MQWGGWAPGKGSGTGPKHVSTTRTLLSHEEACEESYQHVSCPSWTPPAPLARDLGPGWWPSPLWTPCLHRLQDPGAGWVAASTGGRSWPGPQVVWTLLGWGLSGKRHQKLRTKMKPREEPLPPSAEVGAGAPFHSPLSLSSASVSEVTDGHTHTTVRTPKTAQFTATSGQRPPLMLCIHLRGSAAGPRAAFVLPSGPGAHSGHPDRGAAPPYGPVARMQPGRSGPEQTGQVGCGHTGSQNGVNWGQRQSPLH